MKQPFELVLRMATPVSLNHPWLHLDGIMAHLTYQRVLGREYYNLPTKQVAALSQGRAGKYADKFRKWPGRSGIRCASVSIFEPDKLGTLQYFKRFEAADFPARRKVDLGSGHFRTWMLRTIYQACESVTFYGNGDLVIIGDLLQDLTHLGNDTRIGWGRIADTRLRPTEEDWSIVKSGIAMRPIPERFVVEPGDLVPLASRAPYWDPRAVELCVPPGNEVTLIGG